MNAPHIILDCLPSLCQKLSDFVEKFGVAIAKIILLAFFETRCLSFRRRSSQPIA